MNDPFALTPELPLVFDDHGSTTLHPSQFASVDVVQPTIAPRSGVHLEFTTVASSEPHDGFLRRFEHLEHDEREHDDGTASQYRPVDHDHNHDGHVENGPGLDDHGPIGAASAHADDDQFSTYRHDHGTVDDHDDRGAIDFNDDARALLRRDHDERRRERARRRRKIRGQPHARLARRRASPARSRSVDPSSERIVQRSPAVWFSLLGRDQRRQRRDGSAVHLRDNHRDGSTHRVDTRSRPVRSFSTGPLQGVALVLYFVLLPYVLVTKWRFSYTISNGAQLRDLLVGLAIFWFIFLVLLLVYVNQLRHRRAVPANGCAWLAGLIVLALPFLVTSSADAASSSVANAAVAVVSPAVGVTPHASSIAVGSSTHESSRPSSPVHTPQGLSLFAVALAAKSRRDRLRQSSEGLSEDELDVVARQLREGDEQLIAQLRDVIGSDRDGEVLVTTNAFEVPPRFDFEPVVVSLIGEREGGFALGYAREGGALPIDPKWNDEEILTRVVALHDGKVTFASGDNELMRALARRRDASTMVVYLGDPRDLDEELGELCVTLRAVNGTRAVHGPSTRSVRVELLRAYPQVQGLSEDFVPTLRRRCVEMVAYLAMHAGEPITGDRLRTRVLVHANVDASKTTLSNTASSVRRSLGSDAQGHLLEPVVAGLYHLHGVGLDVADFHRLVARGRSSSGEVAYDLFIDALGQVHGEPLASVLKGFEWFTFEGHRAQLQRDGEWVALALHDAALEREDVETAFWALRQGLLLDPESEELLDALERVPRLRQFGGNGSGAAQDQTVRPSRAVAMSWAFERFGR